MPQVPVQTTQQVFGQIHPAYNTVNASPDAFGAQIGAAEQRVGAAGQQLSDTMSQATVAFQGLQNETLAKDADIQLAKKLTDLQMDPQNGYSTKLGKDAVDGYQAYQDSVQQAYKDARAALPNPAAQQMFDAAAVKRVEYSLSSGAQHAAQQNKIWQIGTADARANTEMNVAANYYNDDTRFGQAIATVKDEAQQLGELQGWSPEQVAAKQQSYVSQAWQQRIMRYAQQDPVGAQNMYSANQEQISAADRYRLENFLRENVQPVLASNLVTNVMNGGSTVNGSTLDQLHAAVVKAESGGNIGAIGPNVPGQGTAKGDMQVMDATNLNPGYGVRPAADNSPEERSRVGHDYLNAMIAHYGGDQTLALAAYNWGPHNVDKLVQGARDAGAPLNDAQLLAKTPPATQAYVAKINAAVPPQAGTAPTSDNPGAHLSDWEQQVSSLAGNLYPNDPKFKNMAIAQLFSEKERIVQGQEGQRQEALNSLYAAAMGPDGTGKPTKLTDLLSTPNLKNAWATLQPEQQMGVVRMLDQNARNEDPPINAESLSTMYRLKGEAANDPTAFANEDITKYFGTLPHSFTEQLINMQAAASGRAQRDQSKALNLEHAMSVARPMLLASGVRIPTAKDSPDKAQDYNTFTGRMSDSLEQFYGQNKRAPNDAEVRGMVTSLLQQGVDTSKSAHFWSSAPAPARAFQTAPANFQIPAPDAERPKIVAAWQAQHPGQTPTDGQINQIYTQAQLVAQSRPRGARTAAPVVTGSAANPFQQTQ